MIFAVFVFRGSVPSTLQIPGFQRCPVKRHRLGADARPTHSRIPYQTLTENTIRLSPQVLHSNRNVVVSAPTGSGKTVSITMVHAEASALTFDSQVIFELAIIRMLMSGDADSKVRSRNRPC